MNTISVVIPTYNRARYLERAIRSVWAQTGLPLEMLIIDNCSTDNTGELVERLKTESPIPLNYIFESRPGANFARNTGARCAKGALVVYLDDDAFADPNWLGVYAREFERDPDVACVQGGVMLHFESPKPVWLVPELEGYLASTHRFGYEARVLEPPFFPISANVGIRREVLVSLGGFAARAWRVGNNLLSNDEYELAHKIRKIGKLIFYQPDAKVWHHVPKDRLQPWFFIRRAYWQGVSDALWKQYGDKPGRLQLARMCLVHIRAGLKHIFRCSRYTLKGQRGLAFRELICGVERAGRLRRELIWCSGIGLP